MIKIPRFLSNKLKYNKYHLFAFGFIALVAHPVYWFWFKYVFPNPYESISLRIIGMLSSVTLLFMAYKQDLFKKILPFYWLFMVTYNLPFFFTVNLIKNNLIDVWLMAEIVMIFVVILFIPNIVMALMIMFVGILGAVVFSASENQTNLYPANLLLSHSILYALALVSGYVFNRSNVMGIEAQEKSKYLQDKAESLKTLAGSIAHELRNPLNSINLAQNQSQELLLESSSQDVNQNIKQQLTDINSSISSSVTQANNTINIILADLGNKPIEPSDFSYLSTDKILPEIIKTFGYSNLEEKQKVKLDLKDNFIFRAVDHRFTFIIYNLLKNSLYYLNQYPDSVVTVGVETHNPSLRASNGSAAIQNGDVEVAGLPREAWSDSNADGIDYSKYNVIYVHDTGPGIPAHIIPKLFGDFFTSGKKDGTGLGLAFCKRNMKIFDGDIVVESETAKDGENGWTKFSLLFPKLSEEEIARAKTEAKRKKILIVDDQEVNLITAKSKIEKTLINISCDIANGGKEAIRMAKAGKYHLIIMDIQMPEMNGIITTKEIRKFNQDVPVIAYTSLCYNSFLKETNNPVARNDFNYYLSKSISNHILYRTITKWIIDTPDDFSYLGSKEQYLKAIQGKNILLADDQEMNLLMTRKNLERNGLKVTECRNGKELLEIYKNNLNENNKSNFDVIITDINMNPYNGDDASKEIRAIELNNHLQYKNRIPIIALSGDGQREDIYHFFSCGMTDYFIKGNNPDLLIKIVANYLVKENDAGKKDEIKIIDNNLISDSDLKILNQNKIKDFSKEDLAALLQLFLRDSKELLEKIKQNKESNNIEQIHFFIHRLKGIVGNIGAERLFEYTKNLDLDLRQGKLPKDSDWLNKLEKIYEETIKEIKKIMDE